MYIGCCETRSTNEIYAFDFLSLQKHKIHPSLLLRTVLGKWTSFPSPLRRFPCVSRRKKTHYALLGKHFQGERDPRTTAMRRTTNFPRRKIVRDTDEPTVAPVFTTAKHLYPYTGPQNAVVYRLFAFRVLEMIINIFYSSIDLRYNWDFRASFRRIILKCQSS